LRPREEQGCFPDLDLGTTLKRYRPVAADRQPIDRVSAAHGCVGREVDLGRRLSGDGPAQPGLAS
jgi:hypothetical protein